MLGRSREEQNQKDIAALRAEIDRLGQDLRGLSETLYSLGSRNIGPAAARVREAAATLAQSAGRKARGTPSAAKPGYAAGIAFCVGAAVGFFLRPGRCAEDSDE